MNDFPDFARAFEYENGFYLSCDASRIGKLIAHYELFKMVSNVPGAIVECGVFKGVSLARFAMFRELFENNTSRAVVGFDVFGTFPETCFEADQGPRQAFINSAGAESISVEQMTEVLVQKKCHRNVELVRGDICKTVPEYAAKHPAFKIALLNLDTDIYEPSVAVLEHFWPRIACGGVLILDDYGTFPGETQAVDAYFADKPVQIRKLRHCSTPSFIVKKSPCQPAKGVSVLFEETLL